jgi:hypothetical protein
MDDRRPLNGSAWIDADAGPIVRPYAMTSGRTQPASGAFDLISIVMATRPVSHADSGLQPEAAQILRHCQRPTSVAELAARMDLPAGTVKVLLGDLQALRLIVTRSPAPGAPTRPLLEAVIHGLRAL